MPRLHVRSVFISDLHLGTRGARTALVCIPGNHDEAVRRWLPLGLEIAGIRMAEEAAT